MNKEISKIFAGFLIISVLIFSVLVSAGLDNSTNETNTENNCLWQISIQHS